MAVKLDATLQFALTSDDRDQLRAAARERSLGHGRLVRALTLYGLEHLDDPVVAEYIAKERLEAQERTTEVARQAIAARWEEPETEGEQQ